MTNKIKMALNPFFCLFIIFFNIQNSILAQSGCAGTDATITVCDKDQDASTQNFNLFNELNGSPLTGGTWSTTNPANFYALNRTTGFVNLWKINNAGTHIFTYTNSDCSESATITLNLGAFSGEDNIDGSANACSYENRVNMHRFLGSEIEDKIQDFNGTWEAISPEAVDHLEGIYFNAFTAGPGVYEFTYTVGAVDICPSDQSRVILEVHPAPNPGISTDLIVCVTDDLSAYRNFNLNSYLSQEDANGTWSEVGTGQLSDLTDNSIDVEDIRNKFGHGSYAFKYTVFPSHPVCEEQFAIVNIVILPVLEGSLSSSNYCIGELFTVDLAYNTAILPNGIYAIEYTLDPEIGAIKKDTVHATLTNGEASFNIKKSLVSANDRTTLTISDITGFSPLRLVCSNFDVNATTFIVSDPKVAIESVCEATVVPVQISSILDTSGNFTNGNHTVNYTITAPSSTVTNYSIENLSFTNGNASFNIPSDYITETGDYSTAISIENILNTSCPFEDNFTVTAIPEAIALTLIVDNSCDATKIDVMINAPTLSNGQYSIIYDVVEQNTGVVVINNSINFTGGTANYQVDVAPLEKGNYTISVRSTQNDTTPCRLVFEYEETQNFAVKSIPDVPVGNPQQSFCKSNFGTTGPTLEDLSFTASGDPLFYESATSTDILEITTPLVNNEDYFVSNIDNENNCEGTQRLRIQVTISSPEAPTSNNTTPFFCGSENPTLVNLVVSTANAENVVWFDAATNGNQLPNTTLLVDDTSYFAASETTGNCKSEERLVITPMVYNLAPALLTSELLSICALDDPTISDLSNIEGSNNQEVLWYTSSENGAPLNEDTLLITNTTYYAENYNPENGCRNPNRIAVIVDLSNCNPEDYDFFIPDGFSPNGDNRNDTYFIPNIEKIFPNFTLEIKNRYGRTVFTGDIKNPAWNGTVHGESIAPNGVYFYIINYNKEGFKPKQGRLYLNR